MARRADKRAAKRALMGFAKTLDPGIRALVVFLVFNRFRTFSSCQGGKRHAFEWPTVRMWADERRSAEQTRQRVARSLFRAGVRGFTTRTHFCHAVNRRPTPTPADGIIEVEFFQPPGEDLMVDLVKRRQIVVTDDLRRRSHSPQR